MGRFNFIGKSDSILGAEPFQLGLRYIAYVFLEEVGVPRAARVPTVEEIHF